MGVLGSICTPGKISEFGAEDWPNKRVTAQAAVSSGSSASRASAALGLSPACRSVSKQLGKLIGQGRVIKVFS